MYVRVTVSRETSRLREDVLHWETVYQTTIGNIGKTLIGL
jgi:hypothetical protein